jgi:hypothetical protein
MLMDVKGAGIINRMWMSGTIPKSEEQCRLVRIDMIRNFAEGFDCTFANNTQTTINGNRD